MSVFSTRDVAAAAAARYNRVVTRQRPLSAA